MRGARMLAPCVEVFPILGKPSAAIEPGDGALDNPTAGKHHKYFGVIGALDDFSFELRQEFRERRVEFGSLIAVGNSFFKNGYMPNRVARSRIPPSRSWISAG
jgi:hypothetical protein